LVKRYVQRHSIWFYRQEFLQAAQRKLPVLGRYLRRFGTGCDTVPRWRVIQAWQKQFHLPQSWVGESANATLAMWDASEEYRLSMTWFAAPRAVNLTEIKVPVFRLPALERAFPPHHDFVVFKASVLGAVEVALNEFAREAGVKEADLERHAVPRDLTRAFECLALRICQQLKPQEIAERREYSRDWTSLWRQMQSAAKLINLRLPGRGRPRQPKKIAF
jgi:hypothetical protein